MNSNTVAEKIVDYIEAHINEDLPLDKIADVTSFRICLYNVLDM